MIGVIVSSHPAWAVEEFFQLFKTAWEPFQLGRSYDVVISAGVEVAAGLRTQGVTGFATGEKTTAQARAGRLMPTGLTVLPAHHPS